MEQQTIHTKVSELWKKEGGRKPILTDFDYLRPRTFKEILQRYRIGIYCSIIASFLGIIFLLAYKIGELGRENVTFVSLAVPELVSEASEEEKLERENLETEVDALLKNARHSAVRNVAVNTEDREISSTLKDAKGINSSVYEEARLLQEKMDANRREQEALRETDNATAINTNVTPKVQETAKYKGPTVLSYSLSGRKAVSTPVPAYKCEHGGDVVVTIKVNRRGYVMAAEVNAQKSTKHPDMWEAATSAAMTSRFTVSETAPEPQSGEIAYRFVAQ